MNSEQGRHKRAYERIAENKKLYEDSLDFMMKRANKIFADFIYPDRVTNNPRLYWINYIQSMKHRIAGRCSAPDGTRISHNMPLDQFCYLFADVLCDENISDEEILERLRDTAEKSGLMGWKKLFQSFPDWIIEPKAMEMALNPAAGAQVIKI